MTDIQKEIAIYEGMKKDLELNHSGKWVLIYNGKLINIYDTFESAANYAVAKFNRGPYLIRQIGAKPITLPTSVMQNLL